MCSPDLLTARHLEVLRDQLGVVVDPDPLSDGSLVLQHGGLRIVLRNHAPQDPEYLQLVCLLNLGPEPQDAGDVAAASAALTRDYKAVKAVPTQTGMMLSAGSFIAAPNTMPSLHQLAAVIPRLLNVLHHVVRKVETELEFQALTRGLGLTPPSAAS